MTDFEVTLKMVQSVPVDKLQEALAVTMQQSAGECRYWGKRARATTLDAESVARAKKNLKATQAVSHQLRLVVQLAGTLE